MVAASYVCTKQVIRSPKNNTRTNLAYLSSTLFGLQYQCGVLISMNKTQWIPIVCLRVIAMVSTFVATLIMVTSHDSAKVLGMTFQAKYNNSPTLKYFVIVSTITTVYSLGALFIPPKKLGRHVLVLDLIVMSFLISSFSAAVGIGQLGKEGNSHAGWIPICGQVPKFCHHVTASLIAGFVAVIIYFLLVLYNLNNVLNLVVFKD